MPGFSFASRFRLDGDTTSSTKSGGLPSSAQAVNDALHFIDLLPNTATLPQVALADDGEINFFWRVDGRLVDIGFVGDGMMHYYVSDEAQGVDVDDSIPFSGRSLPRDIRDRFGTDSYGRV